MRSRTFIAALLVAAPACAGVRVRDIALDRGKSEWCVRISASSPTRFTVKRFTDPERLIIDIPDAVLEGEPRIKAADGPLPTLRFSQFERTPDIVRVVVDLPPGFDAAKTPDTPAADIVVRLVHEKARDASLPDARAKSTQRVKASAMPHPPPPSRSAVASRGGIARSTASAFERLESDPRVMDVIAPAWDPDEAAALVRAADAPDIVKKRLVEVLTDERIRTSRYVWGAQSPGAFDCSGLATFIYDDLGVKLPRTSLAQSAFGEEVQREDLRAGDLVFFITRGTQVSHVGVYLGDGRFLHAANPKRNLQITRLDDPYYSARYAGARRVYGEAK
jgi:cell wall-associated NlpC family hydrolase